ncbi:MAG: hypothetical protein ACOYL8_01100 [Patescibacteria group bacterium]
MDDPGEKKVKPREVFEDQILKEEYFKENGWKFCINYASWKIFKKDDDCVIWDPKDGRVIITYKSKVK